MSAVALAAGARVASVGLTSLCGDLVRLNPCSQQLSDTSSVAVGPPADSAVIGVIVVRVRVQVRFMSRAGVHVLTIISVILLLP